MPDFSSLAKAVTGHRNEHGSSRPWKKNGLDCFRLRKVDDTKYLYNPYTGEVITEFTLDEEGNVSANRKNSYWQPVTDNIASLPEPDRTKRVSDGKGAASTLLARFAGNKYRCEWYSAGLIQRVCRGCLSRWDLARALVKVYAIQEDATGYYVFTHIGTGDYSYGKPFGMKLANLWPERESTTKRHPGWNQRHDALIAKLMGGAALSSYLSHSSQSPLDLGGSDPRKVGGVPEWDEDKSSRRALYAKYSGSAYQDGPYVRRSGPGRAKDIAVTNIMLLPEKFYHPLPFREPSASFVKATLGSSILCLHANKEISAKADAYFIMRNAFEAGPVQVLAAMEKYPTNVPVVAMGLRTISKFELQEDAFGRATPEVRALIKKVMSCLRVWPAQQWIKMEALNALQSLTDVLCNRHALILDKKWETTVASAIENLPTYTITKVQVDEFGLESKVDVQMPTTEARYIAAYGAQVFSNMACDESLREKAAIVATPCLKAAIDLIKDDGAVAFYVCAALHNFVYRSEAGHEAVIGTGILDSIIDLLQSEAVLEDDKVRAMVERAYIVLQPDGWRGLHEDASFPPIADFEVDLQKLPSLAASIQ